MSARSVYCNIDLQRASLDSPYQGVGSVGSDGLCHLYRYGPLDIFPDVFRYFRNDVENPVKSMVKYSEVDCLNTPMIQPFTGSCSSVKNLVHGSNRLNRLGECSSRYYSKS